VQLGPNMKRLRELDVGDSIKACVIAGPGDLMAWEDNASMETDGLTVDVVGRGSDLEAAAASAMAVLTENGSTLNRSANGEPTLTDGGSAATPTAHAQAR
jgi:hypothetical protein